MYEDRTYENIVAEALAKAPPGVDVRQGSIFYDAVAGVCFKIAKYYADLSNAFDLVFLTTAVEDYLDEKGAEYSIFRNPATSARYEFSYTGTRPEERERFFSDGQYFSVVKNNGALYLEADDTGISTNSIVSGSAAVPLRNIKGLTSAAFGNLVEPGVNVEEDEDYRQRIREKIAGPAENGNRQHYKTWCEEVAGVGRARIISLWNGENTVKGVLIGADGAPAAEAVVNRVQEYVDPGGTGLGNGVANIGAHFTASAAEAVEVNVSFKATLVNGATQEQAKIEATEAISAYFKELALDTPENETIVLRITTVGGLLYITPSIVDYRDLTFNGVAQNIEIEATEVAVLKGVTFSVDIR